MTSPLWCANEEPHVAHSRRNEFNGTDFCTGRPSLLPTDEDREALWKLIHRLMALGQVHAPQEVADAILAWMEREGFRRSVVSAPSEEAVVEQVRANMRAAWGDVIGFDDLTPEAQQMAREKARRDLTWAVSAPPTITDEMVERAAQKFYAATVRSYAYAPWALAEQEPFLKVARAALRAALGGEA